ncbi:MAG: EAL domain-containing protein [Acidimicrobiales bacterium]
MSTPVGGEVLKNWLGSVDCFPLVRGFGGRRREDRKRALSRQARPSVIALWATYSLLCLVLLGYLATLVARSSGEYWTWLDGWVVCGIECVASALCIAKGLVRAPNRVAVLILGLALASWTFGDIVLTIQSIGGATPPAPSLSDVFYLGFYPLAYCAVAMTMRGQLRRPSTPMWLDGAIAGLGAAAACAAFVFSHILRSSGTGVAVTVTNLAYPIGDLLLLGLVVGASAMLSGRRRAPWILLASGLALNVVGDTSNLLAHSLGATRFGWVFNAIAWPVATVVISIAVWLRPQPSRSFEPERPPGLLLPNLFAASALVVLLVATLHSVSRVAIGLATATLAFVGVRLALSVQSIQTVSLERHRQAVTDDLTGLANRRHLFRVLDAFFAEVKDPHAGDRRMAFLFVDLNHFKEINDSFGHPAGDQLLRQLGDRLSGCLRHGDLLVRLGGDEFAVVLIDGDCEYAKTVAQRLTSSLREPFELDAVKARVSASIGIAMAPTDAADAAGLVWCADVAMYRAKLGNSPFAIFEHNLDDDGDQLRLLEELREAIEVGQLVLHYQPQLDLRSGQILAVEALIRWAHPRLGLIPPSKFLPLAEEASLMWPITKWVFEEAVSQCAAWRITGHGLSVSVNVSSTNLLEPGFAEVVRQQLEHYDLPPSALVLEVTETCLITEFERSRLVIEDLRDLGVVVSIDDFGAGVTSLAYLSSLAVGELKLDRSFILGLAGGETDRDMDLVRSTIDLGHAMGLRIVAEGIEDDVTLSLLAQLGCDLAQGYCISRPMPAGELAFRGSFPAVSAAPQP